MIEKNKFSAGKDKANNYNGVLFDFRLIDFLNTYRFIKTKNDQNTIESAIFVDKIFNDESTH